MNKKSRLTLAVVAAAVLLPIATPSLAGTYDDMLVAIKTGSAPDVRAILNRGLDPNTVDREGYTLLMLAIRDGNGDIVDVLLAAKANPNARNIHGDTALRLAAFKEGPHHRRRETDRTIGHRASLTVRMMASARSWSPAFPASSCPLVRKASRRPNRCRAGRTITARARRLWTESARVASG